ncbi:hypothetical protein FXO38_19874 [Capsicum annuum]|nr:hypothetical protein FXO38_19874 [Capsicum annuum]
MSFCFLVLFLHFVYLLEFSSLSHASSIYDSFVNCLATKSIPQSEISKIVHSPNNPSFNPILQAYIKNRRFFNSSTISKPVIIVAPTEESLVIGVVICTKAINLQLKIHSGGHDYAGISYISNVPFIILDMFNLRAISIDVNDETAWVQAGATLGELYYNIWMRSEVLGFSAGICPTVGVGGHVSGGGYGNMLRKFGLTIDNVLDARLVDINDQNATDTVVQWQNVASKIDNDLFMRLLIQPANFENTTKPDALLNRTGDSLNFSKRKSYYVQEPIPKDALESVFQKMISLGKAGLVFNPYGGRMSEIPEDETPFPHRAEILFKIQYFVNWNEGGVVEEKKLPLTNKRFVQLYDPICFKEPQTSLFEL